MLRKKRVRTAIGKGLQIVARLQHNLLASLDVWISGQDFSGSDASWVRPALKQRLAEVGRFERHDPEKLRRQPLCEAWTSDNQTNNRFIMINMVQIILAKRTPFFPDISRLDCRRLGSIPVPVFARAAERNRTSKARRPWPGAFLAELTHLNTRQSQGPSIR
jgi:hypothetical protein